MEILLSMRNETYRTQSNSVFILNLFALQFISLIALNRLSQFYLKIAQLILVIVDDHWSFSPLTILVHLGFNIFVVGLFVVVKIFASFKYRQLVIKLIGYIILNFKYLMLIPVGYININPLISPSVSIEFKVCCAFNMVMTFLLSAIQLYTNWSNRFVEKDYCNRRQNSILCLFFQFGFVFSTIIFGNLIGSLFLIAVSIFRAYQVSITIQYPLIQSSTFFYSSLNIYMCAIFLVGEGRIGFLQLTCKIIIGVVVSLQFSKAACNFINSYYGSSRNLYKLSKPSSSQRSERQGLEPEQENKLLSDYKDLIVLSRIVLNRIKVMENEEEKNPEWSVWWQKYILILVSHKINCVNEKCQCRSKEDREKQVKIVMEDMRRYMMKLEEDDKSLDIRIMGIYLNVEIINKPLKAYYEIIRMNGEEVSVTNSADLQCLIVETRQCFSRIFLVNNIQNSSLPLMKIIKFQQLIQSLESEVKQVLEANINFNELFTLNSVKIIQVINESKKIFILKEKIGDKLEDLVINYPDSFRVSFFIYIFYQYLEPYRSREKEFKIISQEKNLKRRLFEKEDQQIFSPEHGVIYIDMVQQRGKIKRLTKNVCQLYGHNYEDMISFNINQFMPQIFSKHHHKFLSNFIEYGKIKILSEKKRLIFAKNKHKFIFPVIVRMKTEHLFSDQFGVTALIKKMNTVSQFIIFGSNGKIEQMTQRLYKTIFQPSLKSEVDKTRRLCLLKMIPQIINLINQPNLELKSQNIYESLFIFSNHTEMLEKFKTYKEPRQQDSAYQSTSSYASSIELEQSSTEGSFNGVGLGFAYYSEVFKAFLNDLNFVKLNTFLINYKISKLKTQEFSIFLLEVLSIEAAENPFLAAIDQYKKAAENLGIFEEYGCINENFQKYRQMFEQSDVLNFMFNKNVELEKLNRKAKGKNRDDKGHRRKMITIMNGEKNVQEPESIPDVSELGDFNDIANINNQPELIQRGGSQRSSITDQSQSQSKKQMLINAFNTDVHASTKLLFLINIIVVAKFAILIGFVIISIGVINKMYAEEMKEVMNLNNKQVYEYRLAINQIQSFYELAESRNYTIGSAQKLELEGIKQKLNSQFTDNLVNIKKINQYTREGQNDQIYKMITVYDPHLQIDTQITIVELLNELDFMFRSKTSYKESDFFEINYVAIHDKFEQICLSDIQKTISSKNTGDDVPLIILGLYLFFIVVLALLWIPILYFVSREEKKIINLLSTMNIRQLKRATQKLRILLQNMKTNKIKQINEILTLLNDEKKVENVIEMEKQKSITRNVRLVEEQGSYTVKPKIVAAFILVFIITFSILPITMHLNLMLDDDNYHKVLHVMQETSMLADKVPILVNIYVTNLNKVYSSQNVKEFPSSLYQFAQSEYFNLTEIISQADDVSKDLVSETGSNYKFSDFLCLEIQCSPAEKQQKVKFYDQILLIRNSFSMLGVRKLNLFKKMVKADIDKWIEETNAIGTMSWVSKIYLFARLWNNRFKQTIETTLQSTKQRMIILASILVPVYVFAIIYAQLWLIKKLSKILKNAERIHMHFPVQILAENTYLTSYFNDKIKNNK